MFRNCRFRATLATLAFLSLSGMAAPSEQATPLCVRRVEIIRTLFRGVEPEARGPTEFLYTNEAWTPLAISKVHRPGDPEAYPSKTVFWRWGDDGRFHGPQPLVGFDPKGTDGRFVYLETNDKRGAAGQRRANIPAISAETVSRIFMLDNGGAAQEIFVPPTSGAKLPSIITRARNGFGPIVLTGRPDPEMPERQLQERWAAKGTELTLLSGYKDLRYNFPRVALEIAADDKAVDIKDHRTNTLQTIAVPSYDDVSGIESLTIDRFGWLFVENGGSDYAVKLSRSSHRLSMDRVVEFTGRGWLKRLFDFLFGVDRGVRIDERHYSPQCADQSAVLRMTFFCNPFRVLREGVLEKVGDVADGTVRWMGDATGAGVALVGSRRGGLYATNGYGSQRVSDLNFGLASIQDVPASGRTFLTLSDQSWELVGRYPRLRVQRINFWRNDEGGAPFHCCLNNFGLGSVRFIAMPGSTEVIAVHSTLGVWLLGRREKKMLWKANQSAVDLNTVARADAWGGLAFLTEDRTPYLIKSCKVSS